MSSYNYTFNSLGRIGADTTDNTQRTVQNTKFANYMLSNYFSEVISDSHVNFATQQPDVMFSGIAHGSGLSGSVIDYDSMLLIKTKEDRPLEKLQLNQRPFATVPYLGRGYGDPAIEAQLQQGEIVSDKKSVSTIMDKSFIGYTMFPTDSQMEERVKNPANNIEESAMEGWVRGGATTRDISADPKLKNANRPNHGL